MMKGVPDGGLGVVTTDPQAIALVAKLFRGLADPSRLSLLDALRGGPRSAGDLSQATGLSPSNASNHLSCLHDCGLVARTRSGRRVFYELSDPRVAALLAEAEGLLADVARGVYECTRYAAEP